MKGYVCVLKALGSVNHVNTASGSSASSLDLYDKAKPGMRLEKSRDEIGNIL